MPGQLGCKLFRSPKLDTTTLRQKLSRYRHTTKEEGLNRPLLENVEGFKVSGGFARFKYLFDFVVSVPYRDEMQKILRTAVAEVVVSDPQRENIYYVYGRAAIADGVRVRLGRALAGNDAFIDDLVIPPDRLRKITAQDAVELKYGWWDDIDVYARKGALKGNVFKSKYYSEFKKGNPTLITFESKSTGRTIRISTYGSITFYGQDVKVTEIEDYVAKFIL